MGQNATLECTAVSTSDSNITFKWKHDNVDVDYSKIETEADKKLNRERRSTADISASRIPLISSNINMNMDDNGNEDDEDDDDSSLTDEKQEEEEIIITPNSTVVTSRVFMQNVKSEQAGRYQCIASNQFGTTYSQRFKVTVACK